MNFKAKRCSLSAKQLLLATPEKVFLLLCPTREYDWIESWNCDLVFSTSGYAEQDCIFITDFPGDEKDVWVVDRYEPDTLIEFIRVSASRVIRYRISLESATPETTVALWEQTVTGLNKDGNRQVESMANSAFEAKIKGLEKLLNHYLETGQMLKTAMN